MQKYQQMIKRCASALVLIAMLCSLYVGFERIQIEQDYKTVNLSVNEADVRALANGNDMSNEAMLALLKENGVSQILFKESTISSLETAGDIQIAKGADVKRLSVADQLPSDLPINAGNYYLVVTNEAWREQVLREVPAKLSGAKAYDNGALGVVTVPTSIESTVMGQDKALLGISGIGVGFNKAWMQTVADEGFDIIAQVCGWKNPTEASLEMLVSDIKSVPNLAMLMFNDKDLPGFPGNIPLLHEMLSDENGKLIAPLGQIEFSPQKGFNNLAVMAGKDVVRLHTIPNEEMSKFEGDNNVDLKAGIEKALDRWELAATERNMRSLLVRFFEIDMPGSYLDTNMEYLNAITTSLEEQGFTVGGDTPQMASLQIPSAIRLLIGLGICAGFLLLMMELGLPRLGLLAFAASALLWVALYFKDQVFAMQIMALVSVIEFPILACVHFLPPKKDLSLFKAIVQMIVLCAVSGIGALLMVGVLSDKAFMLKLSSFAGIKVAHLIPILVVPFVIYIWRANKPLELCKNLLNKALDYKWSIVFGVVALALLIYVMRTGNDAGEISGLESGMRQFLNDTMGVRPRSKEFLIGYPATILYLMYGNKRPALWVLTIPLVIGQISLVNTYAHLHTPLLISLERSFNGLVLGIVIAIITVVMVKLGIKLFRCAIDRLATREA